MSRTILEWVGACRRASRPVRYPAGRGTQVMATRMAPDYEPPSMSLTPAGGCPNGGSRSDRSVCTVARWTETEGLRVLTTDGQRIVDAAEGAVRQGVRLAAELVAVGLVPTRLMPCVDHWHAAAAADCYMVTVWRPDGTLVLDGLHESPGGVMAVAADWRRQTVAAAAGRRSVAYRVDCADLMRGCSTPALSWPLPGGVAPGEVPPETPAGWLDALDVAGWRRGPGGSWMCPACAEYAEVVS